jgi:hypothetical protein
VGALGDEDKKLFRIGKGGEANVYTAQEDGELYAFANDLNWKYENNQGVLKVAITRIR